MHEPPARQRAITNYRSLYGAEPTLVVRAPGRVNLIGEHTDYNDGFVLPMALPFEIAIAGEPRTDGQVFAHSEGFDPVEFTIDEPVRPGGWETYVHGTAQMLGDSGYATGGWQATLASDIPAGASLSSSAALEVASGLAFVTSAGATIDPVELARVGQRVENDVLGLPSGIMDQLASAASAPDSAALIDCRSLTLTAVAMPDGLDIVIMDTGTRRELVDSEYAARRADCETAAAALGVPALRDATIDQIDQLTDTRVRRRARHVITENARTLDAAQAMTAGDGAKLGRLMNASHASMRDDYDIVGPAQERMVTLAQQTPGCLGARMTGGGFAGACVALVASDQTTAFIAKLEQRYESPPEQPSTAPVAFYRVRPAPGASVITAPMPPG